jgi:phospholipid-translocating ATPase
VCSAELGKRHWDISSVLMHNESQSSLDLCGGAGGCRLEDVQSVDLHSYPPTTVGALSNTLLSKGSVKRSMD